VANKKLSGNCIGGRKGFSRHSFLDFLKTAKEQKLNWVVITDVEDFFASISHEILQKILAGRFRIARDVWQNGVNSIFLYFFLRPSSGKIW